MRVSRQARTMGTLGLAVALSLIGDLTLYAVLVTQLDAVGISLALVRGNQGLVTASILYAFTMFAGDGVVLSTLSLLLQQRVNDAVSIGGLALGIASAAGLLLGMRSLIAGVVGPLAGHLSDTRIERWSLVAMSLAMGIAGFALLAFASNPRSIMLAVALGATGAGAALAILPALAGDLAPAGRLGLVMGSFTTAGDVGAMAGPFVAFALISVVELRWIYLACSLLFAVGLGLIWRERRRLS